MYAHAQFDAIWAEAYRRLTVRISAATNEKRRLSAYHHRASMLMNYHFFRHMFEREPEAMVICKCRGTIASSHYVEPDRTQILTDRHCFICNLWAREAKHHPRGMVIGGEVYTDSGRVGGRNDFKGFGGAEWAYRKIGDEEVFTTNNMWFGGTVPEEFLHKYPDTHEFVKVKS